MSSPNLAMVQTGASKYLIYGLIDPRDGQLRYVGKSVNGLERAKAHAQPWSIRWSKTHSRNWVKGLVDAGFKPDIEVLETCETAEALVEAEQFHIAYWRFVGADLTNLTAGGEGTIGRRKTLEEVERIRTSNLRAKAKLSAEQLGEMADLYRSGVDCYQLAAKYKIERHTVARHLRRLGVALRNKRQVRRRIPECAVEQLIQKYLDGMTTQQLADEYHSYSSNIYHLLKQRNVSIRNHSEAALLSNSKKKAA